MTAEASLTPDSQLVGQRTRAEGDQESPHIILYLTDEIEPSPQLDLRHYLDRDAGLLAANAFNLRAKRAVDILGSIVALGLLWPMLLITAVAVALTSPGSPIFKQSRIGLGGRSFEFYKFRSMRVPAEEERRQLVDVNEAIGPIFKIKDDPRVTRVGADSSEAPASMNSRSSGTCYEAK